MLGVELKPKHIALIVIGALTVVLGPLFILLVYRERKKSNGGEFYFFPILMTL